MDSFGAMIIKVGRVNRRDGCRLYTAPCRMGHAEFGPNDYWEDAPHFEKLVFRMNIF